MPKKGTNMFIEELPFIMVKCLACTIVIELIAGLIIGIRDKKDLLNIGLVNIMTNPLVVSLPVLMLLKYGLYARNVSLIILELFTVIVEGAVYYKVLKYKKINGFAISLILNLASYLIGEVINNL